MSWTELRKRAGFHEKYFGNVYSYLCGYSHGRYHSAVQVGQARTLEDQKMLSDSVMGVGVVLMAHFAFMYPAVFPGRGGGASFEPCCEGYSGEMAFGADVMSAIYDHPLQ